MWRSKQKPQNSATMDDAAIGVVTFSDAALDELSVAIREALSDDDARREHHMQAAFAPVHQSLMNAASRDGISQEFALPKSQRLWGNFAWRHATLRLAMGAVLLVAVGWGGHQVGRARAQSETRVLPVQSLVDDFDAGLRSPSPFEFVAMRPGDNQQAARWLSRHVGAPVHLPSPARAGVQLLGARRHTLWHHSVAQTHYLKNGVRVALYQVREPRCGLPHMDEVKLRGRVFLTSNNGQYRVVAWRAGDIVMTLVTPLAMRESLQLAANLRSDSEPVV